MDQCTHAVRRQHWKNIISQCQERPDGQSARQWLKENGISEHAYYRWQRRLRQETYDRISGKDSLPATHGGGVSFAEVPLPDAPEALPAAEMTGREIHPVAIIRAGGCSVAVSADIPDGILSRILREVSHA